MTNPFKKTAAPAATGGASATISRPESSDKPPAKAVTARDTFARPKGGGGSSIKDDMGSLLVVRPTDFLKDYTSSVGTGDVVRADWLVCDGENAGEIREEGMIFNRPLVRELARVIRENPGGLFVGRLSLGAREIKGNKPFIFQDFTDEEHALAVECAKSVGWI